MKAISIAVLATAVLFAGACVFGTTAPVKQPEQGWEYAQFLIGHEQSDDGLFYVIPYLLFPDRRLEGTEAIEAELGDLEADSDRFEFAVLNAMGQQGWELTTHHAKSLATMGGVMQHRDEYTFSRLRR